MSVFKEILIDDIPEEGLEIKATKADPWFHGVMTDALGKNFGEGDSANVVVDIIRFEGNVNVDGKIECTSHQTCDRCAENYQQITDFPFHTVLAPLYENERQQRLHGQDDVELVKEDLEFQFYEGDRFDLAEVIREQIVLNDPMKHICREDCAGLCQKCGKNLNAGPCGCEKEAESSTFAALKNIRVNQDTKH